MKNNERNVFEACKQKCPIPLTEIKKGDFLFCQSPTTIWLCIVSHIDGDKVHYFANYNLTAKLLNVNDWFLVDYVKRKANPEETAQMLHQLKLNKYRWIETDLLNQNNVLDINNYIKIHTLTGLVGSQQFVASRKKYPYVIVGVDEEYGLFRTSNNMFQQTDNCKLIPISYIDLKPNDLALRSRNNTKLTEVDICTISNYVKILTKGYVFLEGESIIKSYDIQYRWYKVVKG